MRLLAAALISFAALSGSALAQGMTNGDGNTFIVTEANGVAVRYHFNSDGTWDAVAPDNSTVNGTYTVANGQICLTGSGMSQAACTEYHPDKNVGDTWTQPGTDGQQITVALVAGRP